MGGGVLLGVLENLGASLVSFEYKDVIAFVVIVVILLIKPTGLFVQQRGFRKI